MKETTKRRWKKILLVAGVLAVLATVGLVVDLFYQEKTLPQTLVVALHSSKGGPLVQGEGTLASSEKRISLTRKADDEGKISFPYPTPGTYTITCRAPGYRTTSVSYTTDLASGEIKVHLEPATSPSSTLHLSGRTITKQGKVARSCRLLLSSWDGETTVSGSSNGQGEFQFTDVPPGAYTLQGHWEERVSLRQSLFLPGGADRTGVEVVFPPAATIKVRWTGRGKGPTAVWIFSTYHQRARSHQIDFGDDNECQISGVDTGPVLITAVWPKMGTSATIRGMISERGTTVDIPSPGEAKHLVHGTVLVKTAAKERPLVRLYRIPLYPLPPSEFLVREGNVDGQGRFSLAKVEEGEYFFVVSHRSHPIYLEELEVYGEVEKKLSPPSPTRLTVSTDTGGRLFWRGRHFPYLRGSKVISSGTVKINQLLPGKYDFYLLTGKTGRKKTLSLKGKTTLDWRGREK